jgi:integrase
MPIAPDSFTDRGVKTLPPPEAGQRFSRRRRQDGTDADADGGHGQVMVQVDYFDPDRQPPGFGVRVSRNGTRTWIYLYRHNGVRRRLKLGIVGEIGLRAARDLARDAHEAVRQGKDPASTRKEVRARVDTVKDLAAAYIAEYAKLRKSSWKKDEQILNREVIPFIGRMRATEVTRADIRDQVLKRIIQRDAPVRANHTLEIVRKMYNWAIQEKDFTFNPAALLPKPGGTRPSRTRYLLPAELPRFWAALDPQSLGKRDPDEIGSIAFKLLLLTAQRQMELLRARWAQVDLDNGLWTIPEHVAKNRKESIVPLTPYAASLFRRLRALTNEDHEFVFPSRVLAERDGVEDHMRRVFFEKRIIKIRKAASLEDFTTHDLRRTATTYWGKIQISRELKKRLLNHAVADVTAVYDRFEYMDEKREALSKWESLLFEMIGDKEKVVALARSGSL